jgi:hypothetical protein
LLAPTHPRVERELSRDYLLKIKEEAFSIVAVKSR